jgi:hypothetical protein
MRARSALPKARTSSTSAPATAGGSANASSKEMRSSTGAYSATMPKTIAAKDLVQFEPWRQDHAVRRQQPPGLGHRHRRMHTVRPRLVAGPGDDPARPGTADDDRPRCERRPRPRQLLSCDEERVHVQVHHPPPSTCRHMPILGGQYRNGSECQAVLAENVEATRSTVMSADVDILRSAPAPERTRGATSRSSASM